MIVLVGPDRCGKSTFARALLKEMPGHFYYHHTKPPAGIQPFDYFGRFLCSTRSQVVVDRLHYCEAAYGNTFRGKSEIDKVQWAILELLLASHSPTVIYLKDSFESIKSRWNEEEMFPVDKMQQVMDEYDKLSDHFSWVLNVTDVMDLETGALTLHGQKIAIAASRHNPVIMPPAVGMGSYGDVLIVGDEPSKEKRQGATTCPFREGPASDVLWKSLLKEDGKFENPRIFVTNRSSFQNEHDFEQFVKNGAFQRVVCLGKLADRIAKRITVNKFSIQHPGYINRFEHSKIDDWVKQLKEIIAP